MLLGKLMPNAMFTNENKALRIILLLTEKHFYVLIKSEVLLLFSKHLYEKQFKTVYLLLHFLFQFHIFRTSSKPVMKEAMFSLQGNIDI